MLILPVDKGVDKTIGRAIGNKSQTSQHRGIRGDQHAKIEGLSSQYFFHDIQAVNLGGKLDLGFSLAYFSEHGAEGGIIQTTGRENDPMKRPKLAVRLGEHASHLLIIGNIGANQEHLCAQRLDLSELADFATEVVVLGVALQPRLPLGTRGKE